MKKIINLFFAFLCLSLSANAQTVYNMGTVTGTTINTCSGTFVDAGGVAGNYGNNQNHTVTFCSGGGANLTHIQLDFSRIEVGDDNLCLYDGTTTAAPLIGCFTGVNLPYLIRASAVNPSGCLTITFTSNAATNDNGWSASISCVRSCQTIVAELVSSTPAVVPQPNGYIDICQGQTVSFTGHGLYPQNGFAYNHSDATSTFEWRFGDGSTDVGPSVTHTYNNPGGFFVQLTIKDQQTCTNTNRISQRVRVAGKARFTGTGASLGTICAGDTTPITAVVGTATSVGGTFTPPIFSGDSTFLPDTQFNNGYPSTINIQEFAPGQTLTSIAGLLGICMRMEHSYMGDLTITLRCPNNTVVTLHSSSGGGRVLGIPCDVDGTPGVTGTMQQYCFTPTATQTWVSGPTATVTDVCNGFTHQSLVPGDYRPDLGGTLVNPNPLNNLVGCPLNGTWTLHFQDGLASDNGYLSSWQLNFAPSLFPSIETFTPTIIAQNWLPDPAIVTTVGQNISVSPTCAGVRTFTYSVTNNFGCTYDTTVTLTVRPRNHPLCQTCNGFAIQPIADVAVCTNTPVVLNAPTSGGSGQVSSCFTNNTAFPIPNQSTANPILSPVTVTNVVPATVANGVINEICVNFTHGYDGDLDIYLVSPNGTQIELSTDNGLSGDNYGTTTNGVATQFTCFRPNATLAIGGLGAGAAPFINPAGYLPEGAIANFNGSPTNGTWTLKAADDSGGQSGRLNEWYISFNNTYNVTYNWARNPVTGTLVTSASGAVATVTPVTTTIYTVTATDSYGCTDTETAQVSVTATLPAPVVICDAVTLNSVTVRWNPIVGANSYTVTASAGVVGAITNIAGVNYVTITGLASGVPCTVTVLPVGNCPAVSGSDTCTPGGCTLSVNNPTTVAVSCNGLSNGSVNITRNNGVSPFSYEVSTVPISTITTNNNGVFTGLAAGNYGVTVTDNVGCTATNTFTITQPTPLVVATSTTQATCNNGATGTATATPSGATSPYTYRWSTTPIQQVNATATALVANVYIVTVTDARSCTETGIANVTEPSQMALTLSMIEPGCNGASTGSANVIVDGGSAPFTYRWNTSPTPQTTATATNIPAGTYTVTVTDANICSIIGSVIVTQPSPVDGQVTIPIGGTIACFGGNTGQLDANFSGGTPGYTYVWTGGILGISRNNLVAGTYTVVATDQNGCRGTATGTVTQPALLVATAAETLTITCNGLSNGAALVTTIGGTIPYTYVWSASAGAGATGANPTTLPAGTHAVTVTDANSCSTVTTVTITQPAVLDVTATAQNAVSCFGGNNGSALATVTGGNGGVSYNWDNGFSFSNNPNNLIAGLHTVVATDIKGCATTTSVTILSATQLSATAVMTDSVSCKNGNDGKATVTPVDGTPPYTYLWNNNTYIGQSPINFPTGTFTVTVTDNNGCTVSTTVAILEPLQLIASVLRIDSVTCRTFADGSAIASAIGGTLNYHYDWGGGINTDLNSFLNAGPHTVTVTDNNMCTATASVNILQPLALNIQAVPTENVSCFGGNDGAANSNVSGGTPPYRYDWDSGASLLPNPIDLAAGVHVVVVTDYHNCTASATVTITQPAVFSVSATETTGVGCAGGSNGTATAVPLGGTVPYTYIWDNIPSNNNNVGIGFSVGTHTVVVTDGNNCSTNTTVTITEPLPLTATATLVNDVRCFGNSNGSAIVTPQNGNAPYTYDWDNDNNLQQPANLGAGTHTVLVTDVGNCTIIATVTIGSPTQLTVNVTQLDPVTCFGLANGVGLATATGGTPGYTYLWANNGTNATNNALSAGSRTVRVTDANGCNAVGVGVITQPILLTATAAQIQGTSCNGSSDGVALAAPVGGNGGFTYAWDSPSGTNPANNLTVGLHTVTVTDSKLCSATATAMITQPTILAVIASQITEVSCFGGSNALGNATVTGGTPNYSYLWDNGSVLATPNDLNAGPHTVTVTDSRGCTVIGSAVFTEPTAITATATATNVSCFGGRNGTATVTPLGGTPQYFYVWNTMPNQPNPIATGLPFGNYAVTVTDVRGCSTVAVTTVTEPTELLLSITNITNVTCFGLQNGSATAATIGGTGGVGYSWSDLLTQQTPIMGSVVAGTYFVTATDANSCTKTASAIITQPTELLATATATNITCNGIVDGSVSVTPTGGTAPYTTLWNSPGGNTIGLAAGTYTVTVTDANACSTTTSATVSQPTAIMPFTSFVEPKCFGTLTGTATASATGGASSLYTYLWNTTPAQNLATATQLSAGTYTVTITDINNCTNTASVTLTQPNDLVLTMTQVTVKCFGTPTGSATVTAGGGTPGFTYIWNNGKTDSNPNFLNAGIYTVTVTDRFLCTRSATIEVVQPQIIDIQISSTPTRCNGQAIGTATATVSGGTVSAVSGFTYTWQSANGAIAQNTGTITNLAEGVYTVIVSDMNGCTNSASVSVTTQTVLITNATTTKQIKCYGLTDGAALADATGGVPPYTYAWNTLLGAQTALAEDLAAGVYTVTITDANGCSGTASVTITQPAQLLIPIINTANVKCKGGSDGTAEVVVIGGTAPYSYDWAGAPASQQTQVAISGLAIGLYTVTVTDSNLCTIASSVLITEPENPITVTASGTEAGCSSTPTGTATATVFGGTISAAAGYIYNWSDANGQITAVATSLVVGTYTVTATDINGCTATASAQVLQPSGLTLHFDSNIPPHCRGGRDGGASAFASGGSPNYTFAWNTIPAQIGASASGMTGSQTYTVTATDINGCTGTGSIMIDEPAPITLLIETQPSGCFGAGTGTATVQPNGGSPTYTYAWSDSSLPTVSNLTGLAAGIYNVTVTDVYGCSASSSLTIAQSTPMYIQVRAFGVQCFGENSGLATSVVTGGTRPYTYLWDNSATTASLADLPQGTYTVTVTDANNCTVVASGEVSQPAQLTLAATPNNAKCFGSLDGQIQLVIAGGQAPFVYSYNGGVTYGGNPNLVGVRAGDYALAVRDANGCIATGTTTITQPVRLTVEALASNALIEYEKTVGLKAIANAPNLSYVWKSTPIDSAIVVTNDSTLIGTPLADTYYKVQVTDVNGCTAEDKVFVRVKSVRRTFVANAITPNGDNTNDVLFVQGGRGTERVKYLKVYNRWGELVFESENTPINDPKYGWNAVYKGQTVDPGVFVWFTEVEYSDGQTEILRGSVEVLK